jgi:hypothetical protein
VGYAVYRELKISVTGLSLDTKDCGLVRMLARRSADEFVRNIENAGRRHRRLRHGGDSTSQAFPLLHGNC